MLEWPDSAGDIFVAETSANRLYRYSRGPDGSVKRSDSYVSIGSRGDGKQRQGDRKTPLGVYFVTDRIETRHLHEQYGIAAFPLDYPNARDRQLGRSGDGIWIHGVLPGPGRRPPRDTDGCIALPNEDLRRLIPVFRSQETPVIVAREIRPMAEHRRNALRLELTAAVRAWSADFADGRLAAFLDHYHPDFTYLGLDRDDWSVLQYREFALAGQGQDSLTELFIAADPQEAGLYVTRFELGLDAVEAALKKKRRLYWRRDSSGTLKIIAQDEI